MVNNNFPLSICIVRVIIMAEWLIDKMRKYGMAVIFNWGEGTNNCTSLPEFSELPRGDSTPIFMTLIVKFIVSKIVVLLENNTFQVV